MAEEPQADPRFQKAVELFNDGEWYDAHDVFEELWHETADPHRRSLQGVLQVAVAQLHLQRDNRRGATILFGEALGRLKRPGTPDLGLDIKTLVPLLSSGFDLCNAMKIPSCALSLFCGLSTERRLKSVNLLYVA
jgi:predicted metal-dependent hydrolase